MPLTFDTPGLRFDTGLRFDAMAPAPPLIWDTVITARANNCEAVTPTDLVALQSTGFPLRSTGAPLGQLPAPADLRATATDNEGEIELRCKTVTGAGSYEWQCRLHDGNPPWQALKTGTTAKILVPNLTPGVVYAFRVRAIGAAGPGTWADEATERAPLGAGKVGRVFLNAPPIPAAGGPAALPGRWFSGPSLNPTRPRIFVIVTAQTSKAMPSLLHESSVPAAVPHAS